MEESSPSSTSLKCVYKEGTDSPIVFHGVNRQMQSRTSIHEHPIPLQINGSTIPQSTITATSHKSNQFSAPASAHHPTAVGAETGGEKVCEPPHNNCLAPSGGWTNANDDPQPSAVVLPPPLPTSSDHRHLGKVVNSPADDDATETTTLPSTSPLATCNLNGRGEEEGRKTPPPAAIVLREQRKQQQQKPQVPPKPSQLDIVRYSMSNAQEDMDLDNILQELLELENQLSGETGDQLVFGLPSLPRSSAPSRASVREETQGAKTPRVETTSSTQLLTNSQLYSRRQLDHQQPSVSPDADCGDSAFGDSTECSSSGSNGSAILLGNGTHAGPAERGLTPEVDRRRIADDQRSRHSASTAGTFRAPPATGNHQALSSTSTIGIAMTNSLAGSTNSLATSDMKAQKIREALEKMKEAKMKKIYVKVFLEDQSTRGMLIDERWSVADTMRQLAEKLGIALTSEHCIVEEHPALHIRRIYEDHESVVENLEEWLADSKNKLCFVRCSEKYAFMRQPEHCLVSEKAYEKCLAGQAPSLVPAEGKCSTSGIPSPDERKWTAEARSSLLKSFIESENNMVPELEGWLLLKSDGKKAWKRHFFVLRASGFYYYPKSGKVMRGGTKDLECLCNAYNNQVYTCIDWKRKYKAPTSFGFAIKHSKVQVKTSKYIKYICCDDEMTFRKWMAALRIMRNGFQRLYKNYIILEGGSSGLSRIGSPALRSSFSGLTPVRIEVPRVPAGADEEHRVPPHTMHSPCSSASTTSLPPMNGALQGSCQSSKLLTAVAAGSPVLRMNGRQNTSRKAPVKVASANGNGIGHCVNKWPGSATNGSLTTTSSTANKELEANLPNATFNPSAIACFDRDECGTIKRQPPVESLTPSRLHLSGRNSPPMSPSSVVRGSDGCDDTESFVVEDDSDSDEEQLPPPPPVVSATLLNSHLNGCNGALARPMDHIPPQDSPTHLRLFNNFARPSQPTPHSPPPPTQPATPLLVNGGGLANKKVPPPPPPKRLDTTRLQTQSAENGIARSTESTENGRISATENKLSAQLFNELQSATARQKERIERSLNGCM